ncbi:MAG TPA: hypothetical protein VK927_09805 [Adhaeribacter sp.]|nr:hypothetical protein [Adhaeribacter sp.]
MQNQETNQAAKMPDLASALLDKLTGLNAEVSFDFENMELQMPGKNAASPDNKFRLNGTLRIKTKGNKNQL